MAVIDTGVTVSHILLWWLILYVNLVRLWCLVVWSDTSLDVSVKLFLRCDYIENGRLSKADYPQ